MRNLDDVIKETSMENPRDATRAGPMCEQGNRSPDALEDLNEKNINDVIEDILEVIPSVSLNHVFIALYFYKLLITKFFHKS